MCSGPDDRELLEVGEEMLASILDAMIEDQPVFVYRAGELLGVMSPPGYELLPPSPETITAALAKVRDATA